MGGLPNEPVPDPHVPQTEESQIGEHIMWGRRADHHCDDDLVDYTQENLPSAADSSW